jgi:hypothetical protein
LDCSLNALDLAPLLEHAPSVSPTVQLLIGTHASDEFAGFQNIKYG